MTIFFPVRDSRVGSPLPSSVVCMGSHATQYFPSAQPHFEKWNAVDNLPVAKRFSPKISMINTCFMKLER